MVVMGIAPLSCSQNSLSGKWRHSTHLEAAGFRRATDWQSARMAQSGMASSLRRFCIARVRGVKAFDSRSNDVQEGLLLLGIRA